MKIGMVNCDFCHRNATCGVIDETGEEFNVCDFCEEEFNEQMRMKLRSGRIRSNTYPFHFSSKSKIGIF